MQLIIGSSVIPLEPGMSLPLVYRSPLFLTDENKIPGSYIFNTLIPAGAEIRHEFKQAHRVQRNGRATSELPYILTDGPLKFSGNCIVTDADNDSYDIAFKVGNGDLAGTLANKTLKDLDLGGDRALADSMSAAHNFTGYSPSIFAEESFGDTIDLEFLEIDIDINAEFLDSIFTAKKDQLLALTLRYELSVINATVLYLDVYVNGILINRSEIARNSHEISVDIAVVEGDVINLKVTAQSEFSRHEDYRIDYSLINILIEYVTKTNNISQNADYAVFPLYNPQMLSNFPDDAFYLDNLSIKTLYTSYFRVINYYKNGEFPLMMYGNLEGQSFVCANLFTPFVYLSKILSQIAFEAGYTLLNNPFEHGDFEGCVLFNAYCENTYSGSALSLTPIKSTFNLTDHVPELGQNEFIRYISILTGYMPIVDNNMLTINFVDLKNKHLISSINNSAAFPGILLENPKSTVLSKYNGIKLELKKSGSDKYLENVKEISDKLVPKGAVTTLSELPVSGNKVNDLYEVTELNDYYVYQYDPETYSLKWLFFSKKFPVIYQEGEDTLLTVTSELCPVLTTTMTDDTPGAPANRVWTLPRVDQPGIFEGFPDSLGEEYGLQVLYYKGMSNDSLGQPYPLATCRYADYSGALSFFTDISASGLFENRYKEFLKWLAYETKPVTYKAIFSRRQLNELNFARIYSAKGFNFLINEVRVNMGVDGLSVAEMDIYTC